MHFLHFIDVSKITLYVLCTKLVVIYFVITKCFEKNTLLMLIEASVSF